MIKRIFEKYFSQLLIIVTIAGLAVLGYSYWRDGQEERRYVDLIGTKTKYEQLSKHVAKLESDYKSQQELLAAKEQQWSEINKAKDERIKLLSDATYLIGRHAEKQDGPDYYFETPKRTRNYLINELRLAGPDSPPVGYIMIKHDGRTYKRNYDFEVLVKTLQTKDEQTGHVKIYSKAFLIQKETSPLAKRIDGYKDWTNIEFPLEIIGGTAIIDPTEKQASNTLMWWAPHVNAGVSVGAGGSGAFIKTTLDFSFSGYGKSRNDLKFKFLHLGFNTDSEFKEVGAHFMPFSWRFWPSLLTNTYLGPALGYNNAGWNGQLNLNLSL